MAAGCLLGTWVWLGGCAGHPPKNTDGALFTVTAVPSLNPDQSGHPAPVVVRLYQLSQRDLFDRATFFELYDHDKEVLANSVLAQATLVMQPGETRRFPYDLLPKTRAIGIMADYEQIDRATWRYVVDVLPSTKHSIYVRIGTLDVSGRMTNIKKKKRVNKFINSIAPVWKKFFNKT